MLSIFIPSFIRTLSTVVIRVAVGWQECDFAKQQPLQRFTTAHGGKNEYPKPGSLNFTTVGRIVHATPEHAPEEAIKISSKLYHNLNHSL